MPINFNAFEDDLVNVFRIGRASTNTSENEIAARITELYDIYVKSGTDNNYGNRTARVNKQLLERAISNAFILARASGRKSHFSSIISSGLIAYWAGGVLENLIPPPGAIQVISNNVVSPGTTQFLSVNNTTDEQIFARSLISMFRTHLLTVQGLTIALVPQPAGPPIPITFPWTGYGLR